MTIFHFRIFCNVFQTVILIFSDGAAMKAKTISRIEYRQLVKALVDARDKKRMTQGNLAKNLGWTQSEISKYEHFVRRLDMVEFVDICQILDLDYKELLDRIVLKRR